MPLVIAGPDGWGDSPSRAGRSTSASSGSSRAEDLPALYAAATVFAYPSVREGFGLPVAEAMAQGTPVVTSVGTSTEEVAGGAAVLVDPLDVDDIARGHSTAPEPGRPNWPPPVGQRAAELTWEATAAATLAAYREAPCG